MHAAARRAEDDGFIASLLAAGGLYARLWAHQSGCILGESVDGPPAEAST